MTKRTQIIGEVLNALQDITVVNEFATDLGSVIQPWTGIPMNPEDNTIAAELRDPGEEQEEKPSGWHHRTLTMELYLMAAKGADGPDVIREMIGDVESCLGEYRRGSTLVFNVQLQSNRIGVEQKERFCSFGVVTFRVSYRTQSFNPNT